MAMAKEMEAAKGQENKSWNPPDVPPEVFVRRINLVKKHETALYELSKVMDISDIARVFEGLNKFISLNPSRFPAFMALRKG